eukprot:jgi/Botrbrau1/10284/Bobra.0120s0006.1
MIKCGQAVRLSTAAIVRSSKRSSPKTAKKRKMEGLRIAVEGCCHGELDKIYSTLQLLEEREGKKIDLLICCGDFQVP